MTVTGMRTHQQLSVPWIRGAILGSLWASSEILLGTFLHNLGIPFAGTILATIAVVLLSAALRIWKSPGILWRAGLVCALMKSLSPSAVILGPMIGIAAEALLFAVIVTIFRSSIPGIIAGGMIAAMAPIVQKISGIIILYGIDAARMYVALVETAAGFLQAGHIDPALLIAGLLALHALLGLLAAVAGIAAARRALTENVVHQVLPDVAAAGHPDVTEGKRTPSLPLLLLHIVLLTVTLFFAGSVPLTVFAVLSFAYAGWCAFLYPRLRRQLSRPRLWIEFAFIALLAGVLLGGFATGGTSGYFAGLLAGLQMVVRAVLVVAAFGGISVELRNPLVASWFLRNRLRSLPAALDVAFRTLPVFLASLGEQRRALLHPVTTFARMLATTVALADRVAGELRRVFIVSGASGEGKTTFLQSLSAALRARRIPVGGIFSPVVMVDGTRLGYDVVDITAGSRMHLCRTDGSLVGPTYGPFVFSAEGIVFGNACVERMLHTDPVVIVLDEAGPLELQGKGWAPALESLTLRPPRITIIAVRPALTDDIAHRWAGGNADIRNIRSLQPDTFADELASLISS